MTIKYIKKRIINYQKRRDRKEESFRHKKHTSNRKKKKKKKTKNKFVRLSQRQSLSDNIYQKNRFSITGRLSYHIEGAVALAVVDVVVL